MLRNYLKIAFRNLVKHRVSTLINLFGLTIGVTTCLTIYLITRHELSYDTFHADHERIYRLVGETQFGNPPEKRPAGFVPNAVPEGVRQEIVGIETVAAFHNIESDVLIPNGTGKPQRFEARKRGVDPAEIIVTDPQYFDLFSYQWLAGNPKTALNEPLTLVLSAQKARKYFGDLPPHQYLGKQVIYWDSLRVTVSGVVQDWATPTDLTFTDFISLRSIRGSNLLKQSINLDQWDDIWSSSQAFVKLQPGVTPAQLSSAFSKFSRQHYKGPFVFTPALQPLADLHFNEAYNDNYARKAHLPTLYGLMGVALFILLIAAINFINLSTAQSMSRAQEVGIRKVLGSSRASLLTQFMSETLLLTIGAVLLAQLLVQPVLTEFNAFIPAGVRYDGLTPETALFLLLLTGITALLAGFYPSWVLASYQPARSLKGPIASAGGLKGYFRKSLIVFQFTVSLLFIIGTLFIGRQLAFMRNKELGFSTDAVVSLHTAQLGKADILAEKLRQLTDVQLVTREWFPPMGSSYMVANLKYRGKKDVEMDVSIKAGDENFIPMYQLKLLAGRNYLRSDSLREIVINETYALALGFPKPTDAVGQNVELQGRSYPIVGVVADFHEQSLHEKVGPVFIGYMPRQAGNLGVKLVSQGKSAQEIQTTLAEIERVWQTVYPDHAFSYTFLDDSIAQLYEKEAKTAQLVNVATIIAILISCMGLFGLAMFTAEQRTKEIGVRKVLGASVLSIMRLLSTDFLKLILVALLVASPLAWYATTQWLQGFAYRISVDWWVFGVAGLMAVGIGLLTVSVQSLKAALQNPVDSLRNE
ncbi:FtsX-like permease family protein [Rudanella paleaurantiibacter]|uniref:FtsX-like permease family protein n=1 Tax=Rudanella paleaurantiibacter TaxID=2614655 RepID=A0A7J5TUP6_9BACT|nr:ABC transporter permease [Rudanella paleaurantiibacter]KAB7727874.1 FtsX-like permease family protein [Rudanella paleaurantiibacter]